MTSTRGSAVTDGDPASSACGDSLFEASSEDVGGGALSVAADAAVDIAMSDGTAGAAKALDGGVAERRGGVGRELGVDRPRGSAERTAGWDGKVDAELARAEDGVSDGEAGAGREGVGG